jgi:hypothetical protein
MHINQIKDIAKDQEFLKLLDDVRRNWVVSHTGCGCNNVKVANFVLTVCKVEFDVYCKSKGLS